VDWAHYPKLATKLAQRRELVLKPGEMLYLPLGWWHQAESLDDMNINMNFWLRDPKIFRRPYVLGAAIYTAVHRKLKGVYNCLLPLIASGHLGNGTRPLMIFDKNAHAAVRPHGPCDGGARGRVGTAVRAPRQRRVERRRRGRP
jgi:hypothetical protein